MAWWPFNRKSTGDPLALLKEIYGARASKAGVSVTVDTALKASAALACVRVLAEGVAQVPLKLIRQSPDGRRHAPATDHPLYALMHHAPNEWQTSFDWREQSMYHATLTHGAFSYINRDGTGAVRELLPLPPGQVGVKQDPDWSLRYEWQPTHGARQVIPPGRMLHIRGPSWNGYDGMDFVWLAREAIGLGLAAEEFSAKLHANGAQVGGLMSTEAKIGPEPIKEMAKAFREAMAGSENAFKTLFLDNGWKYTKLAMTALDAQHLETRKFQIEEVARFFRVYPAMIGYSDKAATYASVEQFFLAHVVHSLGPWIARLEQVYDRALLTPKERAAGHRFKFFLNGLLRGAAKDRAEYYAKGLGSGGSDGWLTPNDVRDLEDMDAIEGGDELPRRVASSAPPAKPDPEPDPEPAPSE